MHAELYGARGEHHEAIELLERACISVPVETRGLLLAMLGIEQQRDAARRDRGRARRPCCGERSTR
jgi:hypothetical protein